MTSGPGADGRFAGDDWTLIGGLEGFGIVRGVVITAEDNEARVFPDLRPVFNGRRWGMVLPVAENFFGDATRGDQIATEARIFRSSPGHFYMLIRVQAGDRQAGLVASFDDIQVLSLLRSCLSDGVMCVSLYDSGHNKAHCIEVGLSGASNAEFQRHLLEVVDSGRECDVCDLAMAAAWLKQLRHESLVPGVTPGDIRLAVVMPRHWGSSSDAGETSCPVGAVVH